MAFNLGMSHQTLQNRDKGIETLRGIAIILMVAGHVIGNDTNSGLKVPEDSWFRYFYYSFQYLRMPLFTVISGFVYAIKPVSGSFPLSKFLNRKVSRLLMPFFFAVTFLCVFQALIPGTNNQLPFGQFWKAYIFPYAQFWFVQGIFVVFVIISILDLAGALASFKGWLLVFLLSLVLFYSNIIEIAFFSLDRMPFLLMFFLLGLGMRRFYHIIFNDITIKIIGFSLFFVAIIYQQIVYFQPVLYSENTGAVLTILVGSASAFVLIKTRFYYAPLAWVGNYAYEIFLYHSFGTAGCRIFLKLLGIGNLNVYFFLCLIAGIAFPIIFRLLCNQFPWLTSILFGEKRRSKVNVNTPLVGDNLR